MIVDFTFENYGSFRDEQLFSLVAERPGSHLTDNIAYPDEKIGVLRTAGVYGPNASGKSNLIQALSALRWIVKDSGSLREDQKIHKYNPFKLDEKSGSSPTKFSIEFFDLKGKRFKYSVSYSDHEILEESLDYFPSRQKANIFNRNSGDNWESITFGNLYKGGQRRIPFFKNNSYLSKAGNNAGSPPIIRDVYRYFLSLVVTSANAQFLTPDYFDNEANLDVVSNFLCAVDTGISRISKEQVDPPTPLSIPDSFPDELREAIIKQNSVKFHFWHHSEGGKFVNFDEDRESDGTSKLFSMLPIILECLKDGATLAIDELNNSLHPHIAALLVKIFNDKNVNINNAQLIFTTHDTSLMNSDTMRRDQLWFVQKDHGISHIYSLDEYDKKIVTQNSPFNLWYFDGRFEAVPSIRYKEIAKNLLHYVSPHQNEAES